MSKSPIIEFKGAKRIVAPTHTFAGVGYPSIAPESNDLLARALFARLRVLEPRVLKSLMADLARAAPPPIDDPLVAAVAGPTDDAGIPPRDRHAGFLVQQYALRQELRRQSIGAQQAAALLGVSRQTIHNHIRQDKLLAFRDGDRWRLPTWQFDTSNGDGVVAGLPAVLAALHAAPLARARWFSLPHPALEHRTPAVALRGGQIEAVVRAAARVGVR